MLEAKMSIELVADQRQRLSQVIVHTPSIIKEREKCYSLSFSDSSVVEDFIFYAMSTSHDSVQIKYEGKRILLLQSDVYRNDPISQRTFFTYPSLKDVFVVCDYHTTQNNSSSEKQHHNLLHQRRYPRQT